MKNNLWTIMKKEFARFFGDKRMVMSVILLPGIMIYIMYTFMGSALSGQFTSEDDYQYRIAAVNLPVSVAQAIGASELPLEFEEVDADTADTASQSRAFHSARIAEKTLDLLVIFPADFDEAVTAYSPLTSTTAAPNVEIYYNSAATESGEAYDIFCGLLDSYETLLSNKFDINNGDGTYDLASEKDTTTQIFAMLLPMLLMTFMFSACASIAPESIAGEKERGTIATLLVTPMKRSSLAIGKICSLSVIALLSGLSSFVGTMLSIPKLMAGLMDDMSAAVYGVQEYVLLLMVILSTVLVIVSAISVISAFAKTVKEASTMVTPLMILVMLVGISGMFGGGVATSLPLYLIPLYNSAQCMSGIFSFSYEFSQIGVTIAANLLCTGILITVLTKMFNSEKIMY